MPYCQFLHRRLFDLVGMHNTQCLGEAGALDHHAVGYAPVDPGEGKPLTEDPPAPATASSFLFGAGSLVSTGDDLVRWTTALHHGHVLSEISYREMTTPVRNGYGYGLQIGSLRGHMRLDQSGVVQGFYSELEYFPGTYVSDDGKQPPFTITFDGRHLHLLQDGPGHNPSELRGDYGELDFYLSDEEADLEFSGQNEAVMFDLRASKAILFHRVQPSSVNAP